MPKMPKKQWEKTVKPEMIDVKKGEIKHLAKDIIVERLSNGNLVFYFVDEEDPPTPIGHKKGVKAGDPDRRLFNIDSRDFKVTCPGCGRIIPIHRQYWYFENETLVKAK